MKKLFLWYAGTGTTAEHMKNFFNITSSATIKTAYVDGLGTAKNREESQLAGNYKTNSWTEWFMGFIKKTELGHDQIYGYKEKHQLAQLEHYFKLLDEIDPVKDKEVELVVGGHSRGAAVGLLGFITALYASCKSGQTLKGSPIQKIKIIAVDPVAGHKGNDILGLETEKAFKDNPILYMLNYIAASSGKKNLFKVIYYSARFDARDEFKSDNHWLKYAESQRVNPQIETNFYIGGFRHSSMVFNEEEITQLYPNTACPTILLKEIVKCELQLVQENITGVIQEDIQKIERLAIHNIALGKGNPVLIKQTNIKAYGLVEGYVAYHGSSLQEIILSATNNGKNISALNPSNKIESNQRFINQ